MQPARFANGLRDEIQSSERNAEFAPQFMTHGFAQMSQKNKRCPTLKPGAVANGRPYDGNKWTAHLAKLFSK
jgi:hypothetical protein